MTVSTVNTGAGTFPAVKGSGTSRLSNTAVTLSSSSLSYFVLGSYHKSGTPAFPRVTSLIAHGHSHDYENSASFGVVINNQELVTYYNNPSYDSGFAESDNVVFSYGWSGNSSGATFYNNFVNAGGASFPGFSTVGVNPNTLTIGPGGDGSGNAGVGYLKFAYVLLVASAMSSTDVSNLQSWTNNNWGTSF